MEHNKLDFTKVISLIKENIKAYSITTSIAFVVGAIIAFSIPKEYTTTVSLAPETSGNSGDLGAVAAMVGVNLGGAGDIEDAYYPEIYPNIIASDDFIIPLWNMKVETIDGKINTTYYNYIKAHQKAPWWSLPSQWIAKLTAKESTSGNKTKFDRFRLTQEQYDITQGIKGRIKCNVDKRTNVITISVNDQDPKISAIVADSAQKALQEFIIKYRTNKTRNTVKHLEENYQEIYKKYVNAQSKYSSYADGNWDMVLNSKLMHRQALENDVQLNYAILSQLAQQLAVARGKISERTPSFTVIESASIPLKKSKPRRMIIVLGTILLALVSQTGYFLSRKKA